MEGETLEKLTLGEHRSINTNELCKPKTILITWNIKSIFRKEQTRGDPGAQSQGSAVTLTAWPPKKIPFDTRPLSST